MSCAKNPYGLLTISFLTNQTQPYRHLFREWIDYVRCVKWGTFQCSSIVQIASLTTRYRIVLHRYYNLFFAWLRVIKASHCIYLVTLCDAVTVITGIVVFSKYQVVYKLKSRFALAAQSKTSIWFSVGKKTGELKSTILSLGMGNLSEEKKNVYRRSATYWGQQKTWTHLYNSEAKTVNPQWNAWKSTQQTFSLDNAFASFWGFSISKNRALLRRPGWKTVPLCYHLSRQFAFRSDLSPSL